jgi:hypothetical protein
VAGSSSAPELDDFRGVAQPGLARLLGVQEVGSSNLPTPTEETTALRRTFGGELFLLDAKVLHFVGKHSAQSQQPFGSAECQLAVSNF